MATDPDQLKIHARPQLQQARMVLGFSGGMDGGDVSTGTIDWLVRSLGAELLAEIEPEPFYIYNFPGSMEVSALFRPHVHIENGRVTQLAFPRNFFHHVPAEELILFSGKEPNLRWSDFADCIFAVAEQFHVRRIFFVGSVAGVVPHTRDPRLFCSASSDRLREELQQYGVRFSNYEGPASLITYLTVLAEQRGTELASLVAEIPAYVQGTNPICIESVVRRLAAILGIQVKLDELRTARDVFEKRLGEVVEQKQDLRELIDKLESDYDNEVFDTQMGDLKRWLEQRGIRLD